jgi:DNA-binding winged helix-turn-helix (wHTH) protein
MGEVASSPEPVRFGPFTADMRTGELRNSGLPIRLPGQSFQILATLLSSPGELVTREELQRRLWPDHSFGDLDHGLNAAVNRVREALGDSAEAPRFIETLPRRGYRFIANVARIAGRSQRWMTPRSSPYLTSLSVWIGRPVRWWSVSRAV